MHVFMQYRTLLFLWLLSDTVLFVSAYVLAYFLRVGFIFSSDVEFVPYLFTVALTAPFWLGTLIATRTYAKTRVQTTPRNGMYIAFAGVIGAAIFALLNYFVFSLLLSRMLLFFGIVFSVGAVWVWHIIYAQFLRLYLWNRPAFRVLVVGVTRETRALVTLLNRRKSLLKPVAILDGRGVSDTDIDGVPIRGKLNKLEEVLEKDRITHLLQCSDLEQTLNLLSVCRNHSIVYMLLPSVLGMVEHSEIIEPLEGQPVTVVAPSQSRWGWFLR